MTTANHLQLKIIFAGLVLFAALTEAHYVGSESWCIQLSETHFVCEYKNVNECESAVERSKKMPSFFILPSEENSKPVPAKCIYREKESEPIF